MPSVDSPRGARVLLVAVLVALTGWLLAPTAVAHDMLIASSPEDGQVLPESPAEVSLTFNNPPLAVGSAIVVEDADGEPVVEAEGVVEGTEVRADITDPLPAGEYTAVWRVASSDGHPIEGRIGFTVEAAEPEPTEPAADEPTTDAAAPAPEPTTEATTADPEASATSTPAATDDGSGLPTWAVVAIGVVAVGSVGALIVNAVRRQRSAE
ncbi:copper resistance CopC family protein [Georgenia sp. MJ170]|uniref:copper resistance CopC family protein n=1 Tax=Georgenia sunbinii TaxID=3117728 RepID=UPI002F26435F